MIENIFDEVKEAFDSEFKDTEFGSGTVLVPGVTGKNAVALQTFEKRMQDLFDDKIQKPYVGNDRGVLSIRLLFDNHYLVIDTTGKSNDIFDRMTLATTLIPGKPVVVFDELDPSYEPETLARVFLIEGSPRFYGVAQTPEYSRKPLEDVRAELAVALSGVPAELKKRTTAVLDYLPKSQSVAYMTIEKKAPATILRSSPESLLHGLDNLQGRLAESGYLFSRSATP